MVLFPLGYAIAAICHGVRIEFCEGYRDSFPESNQAPRMTSGMSHGSQSPITLTGQIN